MAPSSSFIDSTASISTLIDDIIDLGTNPPSLYFDLEGIRLSREGSISILQLLAHPKDHVYLIDVHFLKHRIYDSWVEWEDPQRHLRITNHPQSMLRRPQ